ncbi:hypothetical protein H0H87_011606 [Tephrocybe sp. NHM501043]|nr:hypothetical protein H0H87_011606 [Tephrocybe sp. NHM501043]
MQKSDDRRLDVAFEALLGFNPSPKPVKFHAYPKLTSPLSFYDKHVDQRLALKKLILAPSLTSQISRAAQISFNAIKNDDGIHMPPVDENLPTLKPTTIPNNGLPADARRVARRYYIETSFPVSVMASMLLLHPNSPTWTKSFLLKEHRPPRDHDYSALSEGYALQFLKPYLSEGGSTFPVVAREAWNAMDQSTQEEISHARERFRYLAVWQFFYIRREARRALKRMDSLATSEEFPRPACGTLAPSCSPTDSDLPLSPDALRTAWGVPVATFISSGNTPSVGLAGTVTMPHNPIRRSTRTSVAKPHLESRKLEKHVEAEPSASKDTLNSRRIAWSRAVERDSTFIILHCGTYERIAFRHRSSGTLFLSDLIEVEKCSDPAYGAIHVGLYISIIKDVLDRTRQLIDDTEAKVQPKKRKRQTAHSSEIHKRPKTRAAVALEKKQRKTDEANFNAVSAEIANRPLALLRIQHSHYNSQVPASFLRIQRTRKNKTVYKPEEYFCITLTASLGVGGTGDAHEGVIDLMEPGGATLSLSSIVVKFAFESDERRRLRHEYKVYEHLKTSGVKGIPHHFGLFKDAEGDTLALVMTKTGTPLPNRKPQPPPDVYDPSFTVSKSERADFIKVLESIHAAGVRHRDLRGTNLLVDDHGAVSIIDFDRATLNSREETMQREMNHLLSTLDGEDFSGAGLEFVSRGSYRESGAESPDTGNVETWEKTDEDSERADGKGDDSDWEIPDIPLLAFLKHVNEVDENEESGEESSEKSQKTALAGGEKSREYGSDDSKRTVSEGGEDSEDDDISEYQYTDN